MTEKRERHYGGSLSLLVLLLLISWTDLAEAKKPWSKPGQPRVINETYRTIPETQSPAHWITWTNRGSDCVLMTSVWEFLVLPEVPQLLKRCNGPLCKMLKSIAKQKRNSLSLKQFSKCNELAQLLGYKDKGAAGANGYDGIPTMTRLLLTLSSESAEIKERFEAVSDVTRFCDNKKKQTISLHLPFAIVQQLNYDYLSDGKTLFAQATRRSEDRELRDEYGLLADWLSELFSEEQFRKAAGLKGKKPNFFSCKEDQELTVSFRFRRMSKTATHAVFLLQPPTIPWLESKGQRRMDPDAAGYAGHVSLGRNRIIRFKAPGAIFAQKDDRYWELYSCSLATLIWPKQSGSDGSAGEPQGHAYPLWYPQGAQDPPRGRPICYTFERHEAQKLEPIYNETCNRNAPVHTMAFVATRRRGSPESERAEAGADRDSSRGWWNEIDEQPQEGAESLSEQLAEAFEKSADRMFGG